MPVRLVGSEYVCAPNEEQAKKAKQDAADSDEVRRLSGRVTAAAAAAAEEDEAAEEEAARTSGKRANADVDGLLARALAEGKRSRYDAEEGGVVEEGDEDEVALLKRKAGKDKDADKPKSKNLAMDHQSGDSYAECFPESFEGYTMELGPDSDDEANVVRSKKEEDEPEAEAEAEGEEGGKGGNRKERRKKGPGKEKIEELKQEAKLSRELVQLEKYMEERKKKRDQRDDDDDAGGPPARGSRGADISQNEMF